ncbi:type II toxin-antitoxin system PemK/MazF family toxin [Fructobacillus fructosus]|uniref:mRNA interferase n=1 Tax=Fructobacillus fructosus TaxID=1631 RepID=A0ABM9MYU5_9LACO|nr:type II toxin-antitoxin system PemK/MazF family toxin [Fructobacillus fructosus]MBD9366356.1 type II toxin-antitoxin system PemK/MazF family toxin [Leuconostoc mesenteroides]MCH9869385.1 type II toxin-antitoxin system PemK/MazF family toxin [Serratia marcescens]KRN52305.1 endoribonuclease endoA [Fructobacillus fructosus KCTC 3544]MBC9119159.1 type II toxin-antitoxin system PemK/MazF family toxin [Fructobacillus fructosus]MCK8638788.1 type II toxin-antitoxin system PemK/MazF family toxin [Fr
MTADYENVRRGDVFFADLKQGIGSEQGGLRPVLIVQNNRGNQNSPTTIAVAITSKISKAKLPTHVVLPAELGVMKKDSIILGEQIRTIDKLRLRDRIAHIDENDGTMKAVKHALEISLGIK